MKLFDARATNGNGTTFKVARGTNLWRSQLVSMFLWGVLDGATVTIQISPDGTNWFTAKQADGTDASFGAIGHEMIYVRAPWVRAVASGGAQATQSINCQIL